MSIDRIVLAFAGTVILVSLLLGVYVHHVLVLAHRFRRRQPFAVRVHGLLPARDDPAQSSA